ncbi:MAG: transposase, partial [Planctomycetia bacterium]
MLSAGSRGMLADRPAAVAALTKIFLDEIERLLCAVVGGTRDADATARPRPRLGGISFLHRFDRDVPSYFQSLEHLFRYCARPPFALERLFVSRGADGQIARIRYVLPRHWATIWAVNWVGPSRGRKSTRPGANGVVGLSPFEFLDRLADLVPPPRKHRHGYHGVFAPNHKLRPAVTSLAIGNVGKRREAATDGQAAGGRATGGCSDAHQKRRSHDTSRIAWAKLLARVGEEFPLECPACGRDIRLIAFITEPGPIRKILTHLSEPLEPPPVSPARGPPTD